MHLLRSIPELYTSASGRASFVMASASRSGLMAQGTLESGVRTELMEKVNSFILMVKFMMASGKTTKPRVLVSTKISMERNIRGCGQTTSNMGKALRPGLI